VYLVWTLFRREVAGFFDSLIAYIVYAVFLVGVGLFFWVFDGNILKTRAANLDTLFFMGPWFFLFLIPAITMRAFADERKTGTLELMATKPITDWQIILGKYLGAVFLVLFALVPTLLYFLSVYRLGDPTGSIDVGATVGAYLGLFGIGAVFAAVGLFASAVTSNQIVAFLLGVFLCFSLYTLFDFAAELSLWGTAQDAIRQLGIAEHYRSISRGVVDTRDLVYYLSISVFFLAACRYVLRTSRR